MRELTPSELQSSAGCIAKAVGQIGAVLAGWPLQAVAATHGWEVVWSINAGCGLLAAALFVALSDTCPPKVHQS